MKEAAGAAAGYGARIRIIAAPHGGHAHVTRAGMSVFVGSVMAVAISPSSWPVLLLTIGAPAAVTGWVSARLHQPQGAPLALAFAVVAPVALLPRLLFLVRNSIEHARFVPYLYAYVGSTMPRVAMMIVLGVLTGTILAQARLAPSATRQI